MDLTEVVLADGTTRRLGNNPHPQNKLTAKWNVYGDSPTTPMILRDQWKPVDLSSYIDSISDQNGLGACNAFDTIYCVKAARKQQGLLPVELSPGYLYGNINGGVDEGSLLEDAMSWMINNGTVPVSMVGSLDWRSRPAGAAEEAKKYRVLEAWLCPTFDHVASALQCGYFVSVGISWFNNDNIDSDGWIPARGRGRSGGHALCRTGLVYRNGKWGAHGPNSWGGSWGLKGMFTIPESRFDNQIGGFWAIREVVDEGGIIPQGA